MPVPWWQARRLQFLINFGLYLCRLVVERSFGGRIWLAETGPAGTVFKFTVPAEPGTQSRRALPALRAAR